MIPRPPGLTIGVAECNIAPARAENELEKSAEISVHRRQHKGEISSMNESGTGKQKLSQDGPWIDKYLEKHWPTLLLGVLTFLFGFKTYQFLQLRLEHDLKEFRYLPPSFTLMVYAKGILLPFGGPVVFWYIAWQLVYSHARWALALAGAGVALVVWYADELSGGLAALIATPLISMPSAVGLLCFPALLTVSLGNLIMHRLRQHPDRPSVILPQHIEVSAQPSPAVHPRLKVINALLDVGKKTGDPKWARAAARLEAGHQLAEIKSELGDAFDDPLITEALRNVRLV
jgi:hypothetical protein